MDPDTKTENKTTDTQTAQVEKEAKDKRELTAAQKGIVKILAGTALVGLILWLSPYTLAEIMSFIALPALILLILAGLVAGVSLQGQGLLQSLGQESFWRGIQTRLREIQNQK